MDAREPTRTSKLAAQPTRRDAQPTRRAADAQPTRRAAMRLSPASLAAAASQVDKPQTELPQLHHASALRNRVPILKALLKLLPNEEVVGDACEIGAGNRSVTY